MRFLFLHKGFRSMIVLEYIYFPFPISSFFLPWEFLNSPRGRDHDCSAVVWNPKHFFTRRDSTIVFSLDFRHTKEASTIYLTNNKVLPPGGAKRTKFTNPYKTQVKAHTVSSTCLILTSELDQTRLSRYNEWQSET